MTPSEAWALDQAIRRFPWRLRQHPKPDVSPVWVTLIIAEYHRILQKESIMTLTGLEGDLKSAVSDMAADQTTAWGTVATQLTAAQAQLDAIQTRVTAAQAKVTLIQAQLDATAFAELTDQTQVTALQTSNTALQTAITAMQTAITAGGTAVTAGTAAKVTGAAAGVAHKAKSDAVGRS